jgi:hypothetical protein
MDRNAKNIFYSCFFVKEDQMGGARSIHGRNEVHTVFLLENVKRIDHSEYLGVDETIILHWLFWK